MKDNNMIMNNCFHADFSQIEAFGSWKRDLETLKGTDKSLSESQATCLGRKRNPLIQKGSVTFSGEGSLIKVCPFPPHHHFSSALSIYGGAKWGSERGIEKQKPPPPEGPKFPLLGAGPRFDTLTLLPDVKLDTEWALNLDRFYHNKIISPPLFLSLSPLVLFLFFCIELVRNFFVLLNHLMR